MVPGIANRSRRFFYGGILLMSALFQSAFCFAQANEDSLQQAILQSVQQQLNTYLSKPYFDSATIFAPASALELKKIFEEVKEEISAAKSAGDLGGLGKAYHRLSTIDSIKGNYKGAYENLKLSSVYRDSLQRKEIEKKELQAKMQHEFDQKQAAQQLEKEREARKNSIRQLFLLAFLLVLITVSVSTFVAYKREQKAKKVLNVQNKEIEQTLSELKSTQAQLIHAEKMASLGELTAGIAHEIQNPLNFVNNFSEANSELIEELEQATHQGNLDEVRQIVGDIRSNEHKIAHHGKRADTIVKNMLQHSRQTTGAKQPAAINALCEEYLRLSYHGLRAKDKSFTAVLKTSFDESVGKISVVPEELGRVLLNLFNNAFYAVNEKRKEAADGFEPTVSVSTKRLKGKVEVTVKDNGPGIPKEIRNKIFQPFFTTKPTGEGTGLGLSLAYDIITKGHGGTLQMLNGDGQGVVFMIALPA